jgi:hypothetical protein
MVEVVEIQRTFAGWKGVIETPSHLLLYVLDKVSQVAIQVNLDCPEHDVALVVYSSVMSNVTLRRVNLFAHDC